mgnify:CR=1 FL=1
MTYNKEATRAAGTALPARPSTAGPAAQPLGPSHFCHTRTCAAGSRPHLGKHGNSELERKTRTTFYMHSG